jgi:hypothetical protein
MPQCQSLWGNEFPHHRDIGKVTCGIDKAQYCGYTMSTSPLSYRV